MINADFRQGVNFKSSIKSNLYDTPLRELFDEAMKKAYEQYKKTRPKLEASKDSKENSQNASISHTQGEKFDLMSEKIKEAIRQKFEQGIENGANSALNLANSSLNSTSNSADSKSNSNLASVNQNGTNTKNSSIDTLKIFLTTI